VNKMGKSLNNYIAVFDTPQDKYGKVMSIPDSLILNYYSYATDYDTEQLASVKKELESGINPMILKKRLAWEIVRLYHGEDEAGNAQEAFEKLFSKKEIPDEMPEYEVSEETMKLVQLLVQSGLCGTNGEAKRLIKGGGVSLDGEKISSFDAEVEIKDQSVLRAGKRKFIKIRKI